MRSDNPDAAKIAARLHAGTGITAESIATTVYNDSRNGKHYILAGTRFSDRTIWRLKRFLPAAYLKMMKSNARAYSLLIKTLRAGKEGSLRECYVP